MYDREHEANARPMSALRMGAGAATNATAGQRQPELPAAADRQDKAISGLSELISELEVRLMPITRCEPKGESSNGLARTAPLTPAAARIEEHTDRIGALQMQVRSLLDRLEV